MSSFVSVWCRRVALVSASVAAVESQLKFGLTARLKIGLTTIGLTTIGLTA